jgi:hypothetical protein
MSRRNNKIATQAETADHVSALSEAASSSSSSAPIHATRGASAALLEKEIIQDAQPVATSSIGLGSRSFSPIASQSIPPVSFYPSEDVLPPSNQLVQLPEVALPLSTLQVNTAYSLLRILRTFCCENPGVLDTTAALVQLPPVGDVPSPYQVPPPAPAWPVPQLPLRGLSLDGNLINTATALANASRKNVGGPHTSVQDISVGFGTDRMHLNVVCKEPPGVVVYTDPAEEDEGELDTLLDGNYGAKTLEHNECIHYYGDLKDRYRQRRDRKRQLIAQLATLNTRTKLSPAEVRLLAKTLFKEDIQK